MPKERIMSILLMPKTTTTENPVDSIIELVKPVSENGVVNVNLNLNVTINVEARPESDNHDNVFWKPNICHRFSMLFTRRPYSLLCCNCISFHVAWIILMVSVGICGIVFMIVMKSLSVKSGDLYTNTTLLQNTTY